MTKYLVELYLPRTGSGELREAAARARSVTEQMAAEGTPVRYLRSIFVPEDEICFLLYEGPSAEAVREASERTGMQVERIVEALQVTEAEVEG